MVWLLVESFSIIRFKQFISSNRKQTRNNYVYLIVYIVNSFMNKYSHIITFIVDFAETIYENGLELCFCFISNW